MAIHQLDVVVNAPLGTVIDNFEAFLWADDQRVDPDHTPGMTTAVARVNRTTFEETERVDAFLASVDIKTRYQLASDPQGTRITLMFDVPAMLEGLIEKLGESLDAQFAVAAPQWATRVEAYLELQKRVGGATPEIG